MNQNYKKMLTKRQLTERTERNNFAYGFVNFDACKNNVTRSISTDISDRQHNGVNSAPTFAFSLMNQSR